VPAHGCGNQDHGDHHKYHGFPGGDYVFKGQAEGKTKQEGDDGRQLPDTDDFFLRQLFKEVTLEKIIRNHIGSHVNHCIKGGHQGGKHDGEEKAAYSNG